MKIKRIAIGSAVAGIVLGAAAFASAAFTTHTTAFNVGGKAATVQPANASGSVVGAMMPGYYSDVQFTVNNPNGFPIVIDTVNVDPAYGDGGIVDPASCTAAFVAGNDLMGYDGALGSVQAKGTVVPAGGSTSVTLTDALGMGAWAANTCQGASVALPLTVSFTVPTGSEL